MGIPQRMQVPKIESLVVLGMAQLSVLHLLQY